MFKKILVANRGEIAIRVIRAARELGIDTVAVYSEADRLASHTSMASEAVYLGESEPRSSYLNMDAIFAVAEKTGADAIHPGYGFLAENHVFARNCEERGLVFIGPPSDVIQLMGDKVASRKTMIEAQVPVIPGIESESITPKELVKLVAAIGYPILIKAAGGGGGKGMRIVRKSSEIEESLASAKRESLSAFGNETVYIEKYIENPRHIEFQVMADHHGNAVHLFERECSIQRRYQKIVEETPSVAMTEDLRSRMGETAVRVVQVSGYTNAGTVEFLLDSSGNYYFLEMNTRIQVEHPITEMVTGTDLVKAQIAVAAGGPLPYQQDQLSQKGHAIECRIYAEDPENKFFPSPGKILYLREPQGPGVRVDTGIYTGWTVPVYYDPILSKLIVWAENRESACRKMSQALSEYVILGIKTTITFLRDVINHPEFIAGNTNTGFIPAYMPDWKPTRTRFQEQALIAAAMNSLLDKPGNRVSGNGEYRYPDPWDTIGSWQIGKQ